jgi:hypothetical protein
VWSAAPEKGGLRQYPAVDRLHSSFWLTDFDLLDALASVRVTGNVEGSSIDFAAGQRTHRLAGKSVICALDHI